MSASLLFLAIDIANVVCAALLGLWMLIGFPGRRNAQIGALLCISAICHVILARCEYGAWMSPAYRIDVGAFGPALNFVRNTAPGVFMILVYRLFAERPQPPTWLLALFALQMFLEGPAQTLVPSAFQNTLFAQIAPTALQTLFAGFALYWTVQDWRVDLVESRRRTRAVVLLILSVDMVASSILLRVVIPSSSAANYQTHLVLSAINLVIIAALLLRLMGRENSFAFLLDEVTPRFAPARSQRPTEDREALARLKALLEEAKIYRDPSLSLAKLAARVGIPEYRLRLLIHEELGQRNFNAFLHGYRIREACVQLADPALRRTPILTIALSAGYGSINTFNRGFREVTGMTPSEFRMRSDENPSPKTE